LGICGRAGGQSEGSEVQVLSLPSNVSCLSHVRAISGYDETLRNALSSCVDNIIHELVRSASEPLKWIPFIAKGGKPKPLCIPDEHKELFKDVRL